MNTFAILPGFLACYMTAWFVVSLIKKRNDVADVAWGLGFILLAWGSFWWTGNMTERAFLVDILVTVWGLRLAMHISRRHHGKPEDHRYATWRMTWGKWFVLRSFFQIYVLQGALLYLVALPVLVVNIEASSGFSVLDGVGIVVWMIGFYFESRGDAELAEFLKDSSHKGKLLRTGLWSYSRHPNYFGEVTMWWGIWLFALSVPGGWLSMLGPLTITVLILKVSGIPLLELKMSEHPDFVSYQKATNKFFPWRQKN